MYVIPIYILWKVVVIPKVSCYDNKQWRYGNG